jgi:Xaa-Pro aminopeptidase
MRRRRAAFGRELDRGGVSYGLVYGANRSGSAVSWLTGWPVTREALLVVAPEAEDDVLLVSFFNHVPQARRLSATRVEWAGPRVVATALDLMAARGRLPSRIGVAGALPFDQYRLLAAQVPDVVDLGPAYTGLRLVKSEEEMAALRRGAALTDAAIAALADALRPGATDHEVLARTEQAYTAQGGLHHIHYLGLTAMDEPALAAAAVIGQAGFTAIDDLVHGFGGGYLPPVVPAPGRPVATPDFTLAAGMTVVVQPNVVTRDGQAGVQTGELLLVTEQGPERLHAYPPGLQQLG